MTTDAYNMTAGAEDPLYVEGRAHLQGGRWQEAIRCFEELARRDPQDATVTRLLEEARFKARLDAGNQVRARRWILPWRRIVLGAVVVALLAFLLIQGSFLLNHQLGPALAQMRLGQQVAGLLRQGTAQLEAENFDAAEQAFNEVLRLVPGHAEAQAALERAKTGRDIVQRYSQAVRYQQSGDIERALQAFTDLSVIAPGYRDVKIRIADLRRQIDLDSLFAGAEADIAAQKYQDALLKLQQIQQLNPTYKRDVVMNRLFGIYILLGREIVERRPPALDQMPQALDLFTKAAALQPNDPQAAQEQELAGNFLRGQRAYSEKRWSDAVVALGAVYARRADYLAGVFVPSQYDAYMKGGDEFRGTGDCAQAWEQYSRASQLPVDTTMAKARLSELLVCLTPTATPSATPTSTLVPTVDMTALIKGIPLPPTPVPSGTPPPPLASFRNQIVFFADREDQPGLWVMNPDGTNRRYLGLAGRLQKEYDALREKEAWSPDGRYRSYTFQSHADKFAQIYIQGVEKDQFGNLPTWEVTHLGGLTYDPVWSPDGSHVAFVSTEKGSDDIWTTVPDGKQQAWNRTPNKWEWDKHPSWAPDSQRIVFWTNREGTKQIYVMDWEGRIQTNISKVAWDEYDPIWVK